MKADKLVSLLSLWGILVLLWMASSDRLFLFSLYCSCVVHEHSYTDLRMIDCVSSWSGLMHSTSIITTNFTKGITLFLCFTLPPTGVPPTTKEVSSPTHAHTMYTKMNRNAKWVLWCTDNKCALPTCVLSYSFWNARYVRSCWQCLCGVWDNEAPLLIQQTLCGVVWAVTIRAATGCRWVTHSHSDSRTLCHLVKPPAQN